MKNLFLAAVLAFVPAASLAQTAPAPGAAEAPPAALSSAAMADADPALWVVRDADTTIYLFGTFHMLDGRPWFNDEIRTAFDASNELVLEAIVPDDPAAIQSLIFRFAVDPQGRRLSQRMSAEDNAKLNTVLTGLGVPTGAFDPLEPWFVSMSMGALVGQRLGIRPENGPEAALRHAAAGRNLPVHELEGMEWQLSLFDRMPEDQQIAQLRQTIDSVVEMPALLGRMLTAWSTGDVEGLGACCGKAWTRIRRCTACSSPSATRPGRAGSRSGWRAPAPSSSRSARAIWRAATASRPRSRRGGFRRSACPMSKR